MEEGYFFVELGDISLALSPEYEKDLKLKSTVAILGGLDVFRFTRNNEASFTTDEFIPHKQLNEDGTKTFLYGFNGLFLKSNYVELNSQVLNGLANTVLSVKLSILNDAPAAPPAKGAKGAPVPVTPTEETLIEYKIPFHAVVTASGGQLSINGPLGDYGTASSHALVNRDQSTVSFKIAMDNDLGGYTLGARILTWNEASMRGVPHTWTLHAPDVLDPKAKIQPTAADLRTKYIDNINKLLETQSIKAAYRMSIGGQCEGGAEVDDGEGEERDVSMSLMDFMQKTFPVLELSQGTISWDKDAAIAVPVEEDLRQRGDLWTVTWSQSSSIFLHRSEVRKLIEFVSRDPTHAFVPLTVRKIPTPEAVAVEGGEVFATALVDLSGILAAGESQYTVAVSLQGDLMPEASPDCRITLQSNAPLVATAALQALTTTRTPTGTKANPAKPVSNEPSNRDALQELRDEIALTLERIAQEYVALYPTSLQETIETSQQLQQQQGGGSGGGDKRDTASLLEEQKLQFMKYLVTNGLFHDLQEKLRPKVQLLIRERYGARGRALGQSDVLRAVDTNPGHSGDVSRDEATIQAILSELYTFLTQECNVVLNAMFARTVLQKDRADLENPARVLEEPESYRQLYTRLLREANDCLADGRCDRAEALHLERLQCVDREVKLQSDAVILHEVYADYAGFLLQYAAQTVYSSVASSSSSSGEARNEGYQLLMRKAREALALATQRQPHQWETALLYAGVLIELDQQERAGEVLHHVLQVQRGAEDISGLDASFGDFSGYESDRLVPVHPRVYAVLAAYFSILQRPLETRKALLMANRSYSEGDYGDTSSHGQPRRTIVLVLAEIAQYLVRFGQFRLAQTCVQLAKDAEHAATLKAQARNKAALTPPYIRYMLKRAEAESTWGKELGLVMDSNSDDGVDAASQVMLLGADCGSVERAIEAQISAGYTFYRQRQHQERALDAFLAAVTLAMDVSNGYSVTQLQSSQVIPLRAFLLMTKLLLQIGDWVQAVKILLFAAQVYTSASLCLLLGVAYLRQEKLEEAESALLEANMLDYRQADVWAYLCLVCIQRGPHRYAEAEACLFQTLRLQQTDPALLRELSTSFMAIDKLQTAEDLIRRTIALESQSSYASSPMSRTSGNNGTKGGAGSYNRKLLADILAGQNLAAKAIEEYQLVLQDEQSDNQVKLLAAQKCGELLQTLGRQEELPAIHQIIAQLTAANGGADQQ